MNLTHFALALTLLASACTFQPQGNNLDATFHPPLVYENWQAEQYVLPDNSKACTLSSGYNGITVLLKHNSSGNETISVKSNRRMEPGTTLTVNVAGGRFEAYDTYFPSASANALVERLTKGGKAYLEWSEMAGKRGGERNHIQNVIKLDDFAAQFQQCLASFK